MIYNMILVLYTLINLSLNKKKSDLTTVCMSENFYVFLKFSHSILISYNFRATTIDVQFYF